MSRAARSRTARAFLSRPAAGPPKAGKSRSVATPPGIAGVPDAATSGLPVPSIAAAIASTARASAWTEAAIWVKSWM